MVQQGASIVNQPDGQQLRFAICVPQHAADGEFDPAGLRRYLARPQPWDLGGATQVA